MLEVELYCYNGEFPGSVAEISVCQWIKNTLVNGSSHFIHYAKVTENDFMIALDGSDENKLLAYFGKTYIYGPVSES